MRGITCLAACAWLAAAATATGAAPNGTAPTSTAPTSTAPTVTAPTGTAPSATARDGDEPVLYTLGQLIARTLDGWGLSPEELAVVQLGLEDGVLGHPPKVDLAAQAPRLHAVQAERRAALAARDREARARAVEAMTGDGTVRLPAGSLMQALRPGDGPMPAATDHVRVHYEGKLTDGTVFDSSHRRGEPATFPVRGVIACWTEALQAMRVGGRSRVICPPELAYGARGAPPVIQPNATLVFEIELLAIVR